MGRCLTSLAPEPPRQGAAQEGHAPCRSPGGSHETATKRTLGEFSFKVVAGRGRRGHGPADAIPVAGAQINQNHARWEVQSNGLACWVHPRWGFHILTCSERAHWKTTKAPLGPMGSPGLRPVCCSGSQFGFTFPLYGLENRILWVKLRKGTPLGAPGTHWEPLGRSNTPHRDTTKD